MQGRVICIRVIAEMKYQEWMGRVVRVERVRVECVQIYVGMDIVEAEISVMERRCVMCIQELVQLCRSLMGHRVREGHVKEEYVNWIHV